MEFTKEELEVVRESLIHNNVTGSLLEAIDIEIEKLELLDVAFDDDDGCAGGACKL